MKHINPEKIFVLDVTPNWLVEYTQQNFKWFRFMSHNYGDPARPDDGWLFGCMLFDAKNMGWFHDTPTSVYAVHEYFMKDLALKTDTNAIIRDLIRIRVNGMNAASCSGTHTDTEQKNAWVALYYINDSTGTTDIFDFDGTLVKSVEPKAGRFVIFPASYLHKGNPPTSNADWRMTLNFNYIIEGNLNKDLVLYR